MIIVVWRRIFHQKSDIVGLLHGLTHFNSSRHLVIISTEFWFRPANELEERHIVSLFGRCNAEPMVALGKTQWGNFTAMQQLNFRSTCKLFACETRSRKAAIATYIILYPHIYIVKSVKVCLTMKLLTHNMLTSHVKGVTKGYPLLIKVN